MNVNLNAFPKWLNEEMKANQYNINSLSLDTGISRHAIYKYLEGTRVPLLSKYIELLEVLGYELKIERKNK